MADNETNGKEKVSVVNLGCPKNQVDAEVMLGLLREGGHELSANPEDADVIIVNTCGFIQDAKEESVNALLDAVRLKSEGKARRVIAAGCLAQRYAQELHAEIPEVDGFVGVGAQPGIVAAVRATLAGQPYMAVDAPRAVLPEDLPRILSTPPWTAYIKTSDGCDRPCAFCAIPKIRGRMVSRPIEAIVAEAQRLAAQGVREISLIAQDTNRYGMDIYGANRLVDLLRALCGVDGIEWVRPLYYFPTGVSDELIELTATEPRMCKYMDIPLQHVARPLLQRMHRPGDGEKYLRLVEKIRAANPEIAIRSTFIVGYPGETDAEFRELLEFLKTARLDRVGAFQFSPEEGTPAAELPDPVRSHVIRGRYARLMQLQQKISLERNREWVGRRLRVLVEAPTDKEGATRVGRSHRDAPEIDGVVYLRRCDAQPGEFVAAKVVDAGPYDLVARPVRSRADA